MTVEELKIEIQKLNIDDYKELLDFSKDQYTRVVRIRTIEAVKEAKELVDAEKWEELKDLFVENFITYGSGWGQPFIKSLYLQDFEDCIWFDNEELTPEIMKEAVDHYINRNNIII